MDQNPIDDSPPNCVLLKWIRSRWPNGDVGSKAEKVANPDFWGARYRNAQTHEQVATFTATIEKLNEQEYAWRAFYLLERGILKRDRLTEYQPGLSTGSGTCCPSRQETAILEGRARPHTHTPR